MTAGALDLGSITALVTLDDAEFQVGYARVTRQFTTLGSSASKSAAGASELDASLTGVASSSNAAATSLTRAARATSEAGLSASKAAAASDKQAAATQRTVDVTTEAGLAQSKNTQAVLRASAAQERYDALQASGSATTARLAAAQASLISANDRVALSQEKVVASQRFGAQTADRMKSAWAAIPGPVKLGAAALAIGAVEAVKAAVGYQQLVRNLQTGAGESASNLKMVGDGMLTMAGQVGDSASSLAKAMFYVESAGYHGAAGLTLLKTAAEGAKVDFVDLPTMVDALTSAMNAYHEPASRAAQVTNTLIASAAVGKLHLQDLASALGTVLPIAADLHVPLAQVGAAIATMTAQGTNAAKATTSLRFLMASLAGPSTIAAKAMNDVGLSTTQVANSLEHQGLPATLQMITDALGKKFPVGSAQYISALKLIVGGTRGWTAALELTGKSMGTFEQNLASINGRVREAGNSVSDWGAVQHNFSQQWSEFVDGLGAAGIRIGQDLIPALTLALHGLNSLMHGAGDVAGFFQHNEIAAIALGAALSAALLPKIIETAGAFARLVTWNLVGWANTASVAIGSAATAFAEADGAAAKFGAGLAALGLNPVIATLVAVAAAVAVVTHLFNSQQKAAIAAGNAIAASFVHGLDTSNTSLAATASNVQTLTDKIKNFQAGSSLGKNIGELATYGGALNTAKAAASSMAANEAALSRTYGMSRSQIEALAKANGINLAGSYAQVAQAVSGAVGPTAQLTQDTKTLGHSAQASANQVTALANAFALVAGNAISADQGETALRGDIVAMRQAVDKANGSLDRHSAASRTARDALDTTATQALATATAFAKVKGGTDNARHALQQAISSIQAAGGNSKVAQQLVGELTAALHRIPPVTHANVNLNTSNAMSQVNALARSLGQFAAHAWTAVVNIVTHGSATPPTTPVHHATGGLNPGYAPGVDSIAAMESPGEYVEPPEQTRKNLAVLDYIRAGGVVEHFARGGITGGGSFGGKQSLGGGTGSHSGGGGNDGTLQGAVRSAVQTVYRAISAALYQLPTDPTALSDILRRQTAGAVAQERTLPGLKKTYDDLKAKAKEAAHAANQLSNAQGQDAAAAKKHAQSLSDAASKAHQLAANMNGTGKAASAAKAAAEKHARALDQEARKASETATAISNANGKKAKSAQAAAAAAQKAADKAKAAYDKESQAAQAAAQKAAQTAQALIQSLQSQADALKQSVTDFQTSISQGITGDYSLTTIWQSLTGTDANGNPMNPTLEQLQKSLDGILANAKQFAADLTKLVADGAGQDLITQLTQMGTTAGDALAQQLLAAGPGAIKALQSTMGQINDVATTEAQQLGRAFFGAGADMMIELLKGLEHAFPDLKRGLQPIIRELAGMFGSSPSPTPTGTPSKPPSWLTKPSVPAFAAGGMSLGGLALVGERGPEYVSLPAGAQVWRHGTSPRGSDGASLGDVVTRLDALNDRVDRLAAQTGEAVARPFKEAAVAMGNTVSRNRRAGR